MTEARNALSGRVQLSHDLERFPRASVLEQPCALLRRPEHDRPRPEDPGRYRAVERSGIGGERHPRGHVRRHHPVLRDRHEQQVEKEALLLRRLVAGEQQVEELREAQAAHEVAGQVAPAHVDAVGVGLTDRGSSRSGRPAPSRRRYRTR